MINSLNESVTKICSCMITARVVTPNGSELSDTRAWVERTKCAIPQAGVAAKPCRSNAVMDGACAGQHAFDSTPTRWSARSADHRSNSPGGRSPLRCNAQLGWLLPQTQLLSSGFSRFLPSFSNLTSIAYVVRCSFAANCRKGIPISKSLTRAASSSALQGLPVLAGVFFLGGVCVF